MANKIKFKIKGDVFSDLINKLDELTKIENTIKMKIDNDNIMIYSILGGNVLLAFKNFLLKTRDYLEYDDDIDYTIDLVISNAKTFVKNLNFIKDSEKITFDINYKPSQDDDTIMNARSIQISGGKLKVNWVAGEHFEVRDITKSILDQRLNINGRRWYFTIQKSDFSDIKKLSTINSDKIINIDVKDGNVKFTESSAWEMIIDKIESDRNATLILNKRFLSSINDSGDIEFNVFDNFMLVKYENSNLMLSFEQNFED